MERRMMKKKVGEDNVEEKKIGVRCVEDLRCRFGELVVTKAVPLCVKKEVITLTDMKDGDEDEHITLTVQSQYDEDVYYRIGKHMKLGILMEDYCERKGNPSVRFLFEGGRVGKNQIPKQLDLQYDDLIDAFPYYDLGGGYDF